MRPPAVLAALLVAPLVVVAALTAPGAAHAAEAGAARARSAGGDVHGTAGSCALWSSAAGAYGMRCAGGGTARSYAELLAGAPVPGCWLLPAGSEHDLTPADARPVDLGPVPTAPPPVVPTPAPEPAGIPVETPAETLAETPDGTPGDTPGETPEGTPAGAPGGGPAPLPPVQPPPPPPPPVELPERFLRVCLSPAPDARTLAPAWDTTLLTSTVAFLRSDPQRPRFWWELTTGQRRYLTRAEARGGIVEGTLRTTPSRTPRIGQTVAFSAVAASAPTIALGRSRMRGVLTSLEVQPGEPGRRPATCTGPGRELRAGEGERTGPDVCSFRYARTSAAGTGDTPDTYAVSGTQTWRIEASADDGATWDLLREVRRSVRVDLRVTEVQTLVVPFSPVRAEGTP
ncbi:hypothetical protein AB2L27_10165 [Kineococcus sp. LSe6-4]|uniref:Uncharacterized protein n=1 Tax=Kineococcus halophytocola TaxID=3234027 RepID=A0ABV4H2U6_9ACTN